MSTTIINNGSPPGGALNLMSCVGGREPTMEKNGGSSSGSNNNNNNNKSKTFWKFTRWFRKRSNKVAEEGGAGGGSESVGGHESSSSSAILENERCRSTSEISENDDTKPTIITNKRNLQQQKGGLSVSHDSIFQSPVQSCISDDMDEIDVAKSSTSSLYLHRHAPSIELTLHNELSERLKLRRVRGDASEEDEGLPNSPLFNSPDVIINTGSPIRIKKRNNNNNKSQSGYSSGGSLLSIESSDDNMDDDNSRNSSKISLNDNDESPSLNHAAAHHRVAVRPRRTHGAPRRQLNRTTHASPLPVTPELNEEGAAASVANAALKSKCSSLPLKSSPPTSLDDGKLTRSRSSAGTEREKETDEKEKEGGTTSLLTRIFHRRSGRKQQQQHHHHNQQQQQQLQQTMNSVGKPPKSPKFQFKKEQQLEEDEQRFSHVTTTTTTTTTNTKIRKSIEMIDEETSIKRENEQQQLQHYKKQQHPNNNNNSIKIMSMKLGGLSPLQKRVLNLQEEKEEEAGVMDDDDLGFKSLTEFPATNDEQNRRKCAVTKSHSFKTTNEAKREEAILRKLQCEQETTVKKDYFEEFSTSVTVSGPFHTNKQIKNNNNNNKRDNNLNTDGRKVPEFLNIQLNKVDPKPRKNVVLTANLKMDEQQKNQSNQNQRQRRFSRDEIEILEKDGGEKPFPTGDVLQHNKLNVKSNEKSPTDSVVHNKFLMIDENIVTTNNKTVIDKSSTFDGLQQYHQNNNIINNNINNNKLSKNTDKFQKTDDKSPTTDCVVNFKFPKSSTTDVVVAGSNTNDCDVSKRRTSSNNKSSEQSELMKVFARRSLKVKDEDQVMLRAQLEMSSDKENGDESDVNIRNNNNNKNINNNINNNMNNKSVFPRSVSLNAGGGVSDGGDNDVTGPPPPKRHASFNNTEDRSASIGKATLPRNFNERKAQWERRAQEAAMFKKN